MKFEVTFYLKGLFRYKVDEQTTKLIGLQLKEDRDRFETHATLNVDADNTKSAESEARRRFEVYLGLFAVYSAEIRQIAPGSQVDVKDLSTGQIIVAQTLIAYPETFKQEHFRQIETNYYDMLLDKENEYLRTALDYFRLGRIDTRTSNKIIDYFVALEALYGKEEEKTEMRYRFANRIATLLGTDPANRKNLMQLARTLYDKRSTAVHGVTTDLGRDDLSTLFNWVRDSILRFLVLARTYQNHTAIVDEIDSAMLDNSVRDKLRNESEILVGLKL